MKKIFYLLVDFVTLGKGIRKHVSGFSVILPVRFSRYFKTNYELHIINFINDYLKKDMTAIDIGSHIGLMSVIMSKLIGNNGRCYSFEPTKATFKILKKTINLNNCLNIIAYEKAISDFTGKTCFFIANLEAHNANSLVNNHRNINEHSVEVQVITIDEFVTQNNIPRIDFIKINAEGAENSILKGGLRTIERFHPYIVLSLHPQAINNFNSSLSDTWNFIIENNYKVTYKSEEIDKDFFIRQVELFDVFVIPHVENGI